MQRRVPWLIMAATGTTAAMTLYFLVRKYRQQAAANAIGCEGQISGAGCSSATELKMRGNIHFREGRYAEAISDYEEALKVLEQQNDVLDDESLEIQSIIFSNLAASYENLSQLGLAIAFSDKAIIIKPNYAKAYLRKASAYAKLDKYADAIEQFAIALTLNPEWIPSRITQVDTLIAKLSRIETEIEMAKEKPPMAAHEHLRDTLIRDMIPDDIFCKEWIREFLEGDELDEAEQIIEQIRKGDVAKVSERASKFVRTCKQTDCPQVSYYVAILIRSTIYLITSELDKALADLSVITNYSNEAANLPESSKNKLFLAAYIRYAYIHTNNLKIDEALADLEKALIIDPERSYSLNYKGQLLLIGRNYSAAQTCLEKALANLPKNADIASKKKIKITTITAKLNELVQTQINSLAEQEDITRSLQQGVLEMGLIVNDEQKSGADVEILMEYAQVLHDVQAYGPAFQNLMKALEMCTTKEMPFAYPQIAASLIDWSNEPSYASSKLKMLQQAEKLLLLVKSADFTIDMVYQFLAAFEYKRLNLAGAIEHLNDALKTSRRSHEVEVIVSVRIALETAQRVKTQLKIDPKTPIAEFSCYLSTLSKLFLPRT